MLCSVVTAVCNRSAYTRLFLDSLQRTADLPCETIVVDNGSVDDTPELLAAHPGVKVVRNPANLGISRAWNQGVAAARGTYVAVCNNDIVFSPGCLRTLAAELDGRPELGAVFATTNHQVFVTDRARFAAEAALLEGARPGPTWQEVDAFYRGGYFAFAREFVRRHGDVRLRQDCIACSLIRRAAIEATGPFDEGLGPGWEDADFFQRMLLCPPHYLHEVVGGAYAHHFGAATRSQFPEATLSPDRFERKWRRFGLRPMSAYHRGEYGRQEFARLRERLRPVLPFLR